MTGEARACRTQNFQGSRPEDPEPHWSANTITRWRLNSLLHRVKEDVSKVVKSPMPGMVKSVNCKHGDDIAEGQEVCVIEAMKMQNCLTASITGKVKAVYVKPGNTVMEDDVLIEFE
uniref:Lipoyl-binding domain-containing protein n=1 Tax=Timema shepardi TaxID=629360 RepID=A0A7R9BBA5_TIMSH|nr:unnamed protein product [Timema shepardi]